MKSLHFIHAPHARDGLESSMVEYDWDAMVDCLAGGYST
jgi:hypothetical protein